MSGAPSADIERNPAQGKSSSTAAKAYPSSQTGAVFLESGEMSMVNREIDLMEKEKFDLTELRAWAQKTIRESHAPSEL